MNGFKMKLAVVITALCFGKQALAVDISTATLELSGSVPAVFSVTARGLPGDLDLTPGVQVQNRLIGILHFKYNMDVDTIAVSDPAGIGVPASGATPYPFAGGAFILSAPVCTSIDNAVLSAATDLTDVTLADIASAAAKGVTAGGFGYEEDCNLSASWDGQVLGAGQLPLAGVYSLSIQVVMTSL